MLFPAQSRATERDAVMLGAGFERLEIAPRAKIGERGAIGPGRVAGGIEAEMQDAARRLDRREWPGMHLAENDRAQRVRRQPCLVTDGNFRAHGESVACEPDFHKARDLYPLLRIIRPRRFLKPDTERLDP